MLSESYLGGWLVTVEPRKRQDWRKIVADMLWLKLVTSFLAALQTQFPQPAPQPAQVTVAGEKAAPAASNAALTADELLTRLENSDAKLSTIQADVVYDNIMVIAGDRQVRAGKLFFENKSDVTTGEKHRRFAINFDTLQLGDKIETKQQQYIFDGEWLTEKLVSDRQIIKRQVVKPGENFDPLKIGEGPMPIPIGQKKQDITARYDVTLVPATDGLEDDVLKTFVEGAWQLKLVPKTGADRNFKEIRLWYREESKLDGKPVLPRMARTVDSADDVSLVQLIQLKINEKLDEMQFDSTSPNPTWSVVVHPYRDGQ